MRPPLVTQVVSHFPQARSLSNPNLPLREHAGVCSKAARLKHAVCGLKRQPNGTPRGLNKHGTYVMGLAI